MYNVFVPDKEIVNTSDHKPISCADQSIVRWAG